jgi:endogenous inhibitor of DNA gyrase (YacG/DUF329 family)
MNQLQKQRIAELRRLGESYAKIADSLGISVNTIQSYCRRNNLGGDLSIITVQGTENHLYCKNCGNELIQQPGRKTRRFCSDTCCAAWWKANPDQLGKKAVYSFTCGKCGEEFTAYGNKGRKYCSHSCYVADRFGKEVAR